jgi:TolA-binding protein
MKSTIIVSFLFLALTSCIKTAGQVEREKKVDSMNEQFKDQRGLVADLVDNMKDLQTQLNKMNGRLEELEHRQKQMNPEDMKHMRESMALIKTQEEAQATQLNQIQNELKEQRAFMEKVTASLTSLHHAKPEAKAKKKSAKGQLAEGLALIKEDKFSEAKGILEDLVDNEELTPGDKNKVLFGMGKVEYFTKNYDKSMVFFSKIYTKHPKATLAPASLLFIGRSLEKMGKKDEAKEAFVRVTEDYPGTKEASEAKKEI